MVTVVFSFKKCGISNNIDVLTLSMRDSTLTWLMSAGVVAL